MPRVTRSLDPDSKLMLAYVHEGWRARIALCPKPRYGSTAQCRAFAFGYGLAEAAILAGDVREVVH